MASVLLFSIRMLISLLSAVAIGGGFINISGLRPIDLMFKRYPNAPFALFCCSHDKYIRSPKLSYNSPKLFINNFGVGL